MTDHLFIDQNALTRFDGRPIGGATIDLLNMDAVADHLARTAERPRFQGPKDPMAYLRERRCVIEDNGQLLVTPAGVLCFGKNPQQLFPSAVVTVVKFRGVIANAGEQAD